MESKVAVFSPVLPDLDPMPEDSSMSFCTAIGISEFSYHIPSTAPRIPSFSHIAYRIPTLSHRMLAPEDFSSRLIQPFKFIDEFINL